MGKILKKITHTHMHTNRANFFRIEIRWNEERIKRKKYDVKTNFYNGTLKGKEREKESKKQNYIL